MAVMEQKGIQDLDIASKQYIGMHPHAHILVRRNIDISPSTFVKNLISSFQRFYKIPPTTKTLYRMPCPPEFIQDKITYITSGGKTAAVKIDVKQLIKCGDKKMTSLRSILMGQSIQNRGSWQTQKPPIKKKLYPRLVFIKIYKILLKI